MATGSQNTSSQWVNPYEQEETPAELKKRRKKEAEAKEKEKREAKEREKREAKEREREAKEREKEARRKEAKEKAKRKEAKEKERALKKQKHSEGNSSDKHSQGQPHTPDTTDHFDIPVIPVDSDKKWAERTGEGRKSSAPSDSSLSRLSTQKMESVSVMPNKVHVIASLICGYLYMYLMNKCA